MFDPASSWRHAPLVAGLSAFLVGFVVAAALKEEPAEVPKASPPAKPAALDSPYKDFPTMVDTEWWCLCYVRTIAGRREDVTACRESVSQCNALRLKMATNVIVVPGTLGICRSTPGPYPWSRLGTREKWQDSAKTGAYVSYGSCLVR
jgi:hypothetical protein